MYFFCGFKRRAAIIKRGRATAKVWFSQELRMTGSLHASPAQEDEGLKKVVQAPNMENIQEYCRASSNLGTSMRGRSRKLKLQTCISSMARMSQLISPVHFSPMP